VNDVLSDQAGSFKVSNGDEQKKRSIKDIVEDKLLEVNLFSPGGLNIAGKLAKEDFCTVLIETLEKKVAYK